jgi:hypothetical protein
MRLHCSVTYTRGNFKKKRSPILEMLYVPQAYGGLGLIKGEVPKGLKLHVWYSTCPYPTFSFRPEFSRAIARGDVHDTHVIAQMPYISDKARLIGTANREIGESAVAGKAPADEVKFGYNRYLDRLNEWFQGLSRGQEISSLNVHTIPFDYGSAMQYWLNLAKGEMSGYCYATSSFIASAAGMSSNSAFLQVIDQLRSSCGGSLSMAIVEFARRTMPPHLSGRCFKIAALLTKIPLEHRMAWFNGELGLLPVPDTGSSKVNSVIRWITLKLVEDNIASVFTNKGSKYVVHAIASLEQKVSNLVDTELKKVVESYGD